MISSWMEPAKSKAKAKSTKSAKATGKSKSKATATAKKINRLRSVAGGGGAAFLSDVSFASLPLNPAVHKALGPGGFGYEMLSLPQSRFLPQLLDASARHTDAFIKASTGSGKTLGFLLPALQTAIFDRRSSSSAAGTAGTAGTACVRILILSPSRELASQTEHEARKLLVHAPQVRTGLMIGGIDKKRDLRMLTEATPHLLIATPGRLADVMFDTAHPAAARALSSCVRVAVLDEADRLLDSGFAPAIRRIFGALPPPSSRRTLMFTATVTPEVLDIAKAFMRPDHLVLDASAGAGAGKGAADLVGAQDDQAHIRQSAVLAPADQIHLALCQAILSRVEADPSKHKILVFLPSKAMAAFVAAGFMEHGAHLCPGADVGKTRTLLLTGDLPQRQRDAAADKFRNEPGHVLFASDVAGRGMDFPGVTTVVQLGVAKPEVYRQRVGRTGRGGADGEAVIVLGSDEAAMLKAIQDAQTNQIEVIPFGTAVPPAPPPPVGAGAAAAKSKSKSKRASATATASSDAAVAGGGGLSGKLVKLAERAYMGMLGAYNSELRILRWSKQELIDNMGARFRGMGLSPLPTISDKMLKKMGLAGVITAR